MKKTGLFTTLFVAAILIFIGCSPKTTDGTVALKRGNITGNWVLSSVTYEGIPAAAIKSLFNEGPAKCFEGSTWSFTNSGNGSYTLPGGTGCSAKTQTIFWSASTADETFQFKKINEGQKAKDVLDGYRLVLTAASGQMLTLKSPVDIGGGAAAYAVLNFTKATN